jgi:quinol-cytochrome oxidoreductase complex cytochrome b subunit
VDYPCWYNLNYLWSFGSLAGFFLVVQIITGITLSINYTANVDLAFYSIENILRNIENG